jgi:cytochrome c5
MRRNALLFVVPCDGASRSDREPPRALRSDSEVTPSMTLKIRSRRSWALAGLMVSLLSTAACRESKPPAAPATPTARQVVQLNQGWSEREARFYDHANEGTNLAPLEFVLNLPDPAKDGSRFVDKLSAYGFIPSDKSASNPHGLPVGFAIDDRPAKFGDRVYVGITCSACHSRQLTYSKASGQAGWILPVYGGPGLVDFQRFNRDFYDAIFALLDNDKLAGAFAQGVLGRAPGADDLAALRKEIRDFSEPVAVTRSILSDWKIPAADFGPGNLNALSQGNYNNLGLFASLGKKGLVAPSTDPPAKPRFEGSVNLPPLWFAHADTWAQWFAEIHDPGPRNWIQSVSSSAVRPPKMVASLKGAVVLASIHFDNIAQIQRSLELLRTPKWPEAVFGSLDRAKVEEGRALYEEHCARCHTRTALPPNSLGIVFKERPAFDVGSDPTSYREFAADAAIRVAGLRRLSGGMLAMRQAQLAATFGQDTASNYMNLYSRGRPNEFALAKDDYKDAKDATWPKTGAAYWASPLEGIFASSPYFHNGSVRTLRDVLTPPAERPKTFRTGTTEFDVDGVGLQSDGPFIYDTSEPGKGNGGHVAGTDLPQDKKAALIEYLKSL